MELSQNKYALYPPIEPNVEKWAISRISRDLTPFKQQFAERSRQHILSLLNNDPKRLHDELAKALYLERLRMKAEPWSNDPRDEKPFWGKVNEDLVDSSQLKSLEAFQADQEIFQRIINRYVNEIVGYFSPNTYELATSYVPHIVARLLNTVSTRRIVARDIDLNSRLKITGNLDNIRQLSQKGTILLTPTHFSNLDSLLVGWAVSSIGLPALLYGGGLNLFKGLVFSYFMNRLGAYKVDRRKKNLIYIETLKMYSQLTLQAGCHSLFFPGGTRSRSGQIESHLKLGLLSSAIEAQRCNFIEQPNDPKKIFVLPLAINYHFTLEASSLIDEHLKRSGKERYFIDRDQFPGILKTAKFLNKIISTESEIILSFGEPMDILGNPVDPNGNSHDQRNQPLDLKQYFTHNNQITTDYQRDSEYTKILANNIIKAFHRCNTVLSSHIIAFVAYQLLLRKNPSLDTFGILRLPDDATYIPYNVFEQTVRLLQTELVCRAQDKQLNIATHVTQPVAELIQHALKNLGIYHSIPPIAQTREGDIHAQNMNLLYYYHNRLMGYELETLF